MQGTKDRFRLKAGILAAQKKNQQMLFMNRFLKGD